MLTFGYYCFKRIKNTYFINMGNTSLPSGLKFESPGARIAAAARAGLAYFGAAGAGDLGSHAAANTKKPKPNKLQRKAGNAPQIPPILPPFLTPPDLLSRTEAHCVHLQRSPTL